MADNELTRVEFTDEIDLHHFHPRDAGGILRDFLDHAESAGYRSVRIVHGKGKSVIKAMVVKELGTRSGITRFADDPGNWGATIAWLRREGGA
jgi:DNA-nicking Smr family endonuclease